MERTPDKPSTTQDLKQEDVKDAKHEGAREGRPERPLAAEGKTEHAKAEPKGPDAGGEGSDNVTQDTAETSKPEGQAEAGAQGDEKPSQGI